MIRAQTAKPASVDVENTHLRNKCNDFMIMTNKEMRKTASATNKNMEAPNAQK